MKTYLYRLFNSGNDLLYVGVTSGLTARFADHKHSKPWWDDVHTMAITVHETREAALAEEAKAIALETPEHNQIPGHHFPTTKEALDLSPKVRKRNLPLPPDEVAYLKSLDGEDVYIRAAELKQAGWAVTEIIKAARVIPEIGGFRMQLRYRANKTSGVPVPIPPMSREQKRILSHVPRAYLTDEEKIKLKELASYSRRLRPQYTEAHPVGAKVQEFREFIVELRAKGVNQNDIAEAAGLDRSRIQKRYQEGLGNKS